MKFLDIRGYIVFNVYISYLCNLSTVGAYHVRLFVAVALLVFRYCAELVVHYKVGVYEQRDGVVYSCPAYPELLLFLEDSEKVLNLEIAIYRIYGIKNCEPFGGASAFVLLQILCKYLVYSL